MATAKQIVNKVLSVTVAVLMVVLMMPAVPLAGGNAATRAFAGETSDAATLVTSFEYDSHSASAEPQTFVQEKPGEAVYNYAAANSLLPELPVGEVTDTESAIYQAVQAKIDELNLSGTEKETLEIAADSTSSSWGVFSDDSTARNGVRPVVANGSGVLEVSSTTAPWTFTVSGVPTEGVTPQVAVSVDGTAVTVGYKYSYTKDAPAVEPDVTETPTGQLDSTESGAGSSPEVVEGAGTVTIDYYAFPEGYTVTYGVNITDGWGSPNDVESIEATGLEYGGDPYEYSARVRGKGLTAEISNSANEDYFTVEASYDSGGPFQARALTVKVTPLKAFDDGERMATVTWKYPNGEVFKEQKVTVPSISPKPIDAVTLDNQPFRLDADQQAAVLADANQKLREATGDSSLADYYSAVSFASGFDATGMACAPELAFTKNANMTSDEAEAWANYLVTDPESVSIAGIRSVSWDDDASGLQVSAAQGVLNGSVTLTAATARSVWVNAEPTAQWGGFGLSYGTAVPTDVAGFAETQTFDKGEGIHPVQIYARYMGSDQAAGCATNEIVEVTNVVYQLDRTNPVIQNAVPSSPYASTTLGGIFFGQSQVDVTMTIVDQQGANASTEVQGETLSLSSGMNNVDVAYHDSETGADMAVSGIAPSAQNSAEYVFTIEGDKDVAKSDIQVVATDNAGNQLDTNAADAKGIPLEVTRLVADAAAPQIDVAWSTYDAHNGHYYNTNRTMTITIEDAFFNYVQDYGNDQVVASVRQNGQTILEIHPRDFVETSSNSNVWRYSLPFTVDADWEVTSPTVSDLLGRGASASGDTFTIDKTAPAMTVSFDNNSAQNGNYYNAARTATITVVEHNFSGSLVNITPTAAAGNGDTVGQPLVSGWSSNGDVHTATVTFPGQGVYAMTINGTDLALNALTSYSCPEFVVDTVEPELAITVNGVEAAGIQPYGGQAQPNVTVDDTNIDAASAAGIAIVKISYPNVEGDAESTYPVSLSTSATNITASYPDPASEVANDGIYLLSVTVRDLAGNEKAGSAVWSVNRFGSTYLIEDDSTLSILKKGYVAAADLNDVVVREINPSGHIDEVTDTGESPSTVELTRDSTNTTLGAGDDYQVQADGAEGQSWFDYVYTVFDANFEQDGSYSVLFHSIDKAGNESENTSNTGANAASGSQEASARVAFKVDSTSPIANFVDLESLSSKGVYSEEAHTGQVTVEDNMRISSVDIKVNGQTQTRLGEDDIYSGASGAEAASITRTYDVQLSSSDQPQTVEVVVTDAAGNSTTVSAGDIMVTTNPLLQWFYNTPLFVGSIVAVLALAGVGIAAALKRRGKKDDQKAQAA